MYLMSIRTCLRRRQVAYREPIDPLIAGCMHAMYTVQGLPLGARRMRPNFLTNYKSSTDIKRREMLE